MSGPGSVPGRQPLRRGAPHGRDAVSRSLVEAAAALFADRGPNAVSVREVSDAARVNHGLVHKYFGSKDRLLGAALDHLARQAAEELGSGDRAGALFDPDSPVRRHARILAFLILEGRDPASVTNSFPTMERLIEQFRGAGRSPADARQEAVQLTALVLGWEFFEPFLSAAAGLRASGASSRRMLETAVERLRRSAPKTPATA